MRTLVAVAFGILLMAGPAAAQDDKPVDFNVGFGWVFPSGDFKNSFDTGWNGAFAATFNVSPAVGLQGEYMYARMNGPERLINVSATPNGVASDQLLESNHQMHTFTANAVFKSLSTERLVGGYVIGGLGLYHRRFRSRPPRSASRRSAIRIGTSAIRPRCRWTTSSATDRRMTSASTSAAASASA